MLVLQQVDVLPAGVTFIVTDEGVTKLEGYKSKIDNSVNFLTAYEADLYYKVYQTFRVAKLEAKLGVNANNEQTIDYVIEIRGE